jgi:hypothetical protein
MLGVFEGRWECLHIEGGVVAWSKARHLAFTIRNYLDYTKANIEGMLLYSSYDQTWIYPVTISPLPHANTIIHENQNEYGSH